MGARNPVVVVAAHNEADRIAATLRALSEAFPEADLVVADDASADGTADLALAHGAKLVSRGRPHGKGANVTAAIATVLDRAGDPPTFLLCDGDLGESARRLRPLVEAVERDDCDLAVAAFRNPVGGGFGITVGFARWAIRRRCGFRARTPISGQRAIRAGVVRELVPFAPGYGMETAMTIDAVRAGFTVREVELDLAHRATGRTLGGFLHRSRQLRDIARAWWSRR